MKKFMIDIETTGVNRKTDDIIEIAIVEMIPIENTRPLMYLAGAEYHRILHTNKQPLGKFAIENMTELYKKANEVNEISKEKINDEINGYLWECGSCGSADTQLVGWNVSTFDMQMMFEKGYLEQSGYDKDDNMTGDVHYRPYEISGVIEGLSDSYGLPRRVITEMAKNINSGYKIGLPDGKIHDAMYDCYNQINMLNGLNSIRTILK